MAHSFSVYYGGSWRTAIGVYLYDGTAWRTAQNAYIWDGGAWRLGFTSADISGLNGHMTINDPTAGELDINWSHSGDVSGFTIDILGDGDGGAGYGHTITTGADPALNTYHASLSGLAWFSTLNTVDIKVQLKDGGGGVVRELTMSGPYPYP